MGFTNSPALGDELPVEFIQNTLEYLIDLPEGIAISYPAFADGLIDKGPLVWHSSHYDHARDILHSIIETIVVNPLVNFGVLETQYGAKNLHGFDFIELKTVRLTPVAKGMLRLL